MNAAAANSPLFTPRRSLRARPLAAPAELAARAARATLAICRLLALLVALPLVLVLGAGAPALAQPGAPGDTSSPRTPDAIRGLEYKEHLGATLPLDLEFTDSYGKRVKLGKFFGQSPEGAGDSRPTIILMVYFRCPMQCPGIMQRLYNRLNQLDLNVGEKYNVLIVSFDPTEDYLRAAEQRKSGHATYTRRMNDSIKASWEYLTDSGGNGGKLADALGFPYRYLPESNQYSHGTEFFIVSPKGTISRYLYGLDFPTVTLRLALLEASEGKIGTTVDKVLLWCFHFDPHANRYVIQAFRVMQVGATLCAAALAAVLGWMMVLERRRRWRRLEQARQSSPADSAFPPASAGPAARTV